MVERILLVLYSYHHHNTEKIANVFARILDAMIRTPKEITPEDFKDYDLIGFGSGIYSSNHHQSMLDLVDRLPKEENKKSFIFSTCGVPGFAFDRGHVEDYLQKVHLSIKKKLQLKGYMILGEFICPGWNTNKFLKIFGGINKGRPNAEDLNNAELFAKKIKKQLNDTDND